jgi:hypothetical protein
MAEGIADEGAVPVPMETNLTQKVIELLDKEMLT